MLCDSYVWYNCDIDRHTLNNSPQVLSCDALQIAISRTINNSDTHHRYILFLLPNRFPSMAGDKESSRRLTVFLLRFLVSKREYERLECVVSPYTPESLRPHLPSTADFDEKPRKKDIGILEAALGTRDEYLPGTVRQGTRVFAGTYVAVTLVDVVLIGVIKRHR